MIGEGDTRSLFFPLFLSIPTGFLYAHQRVSVSLSVRVGTKRECETRGRGCERGVGKKHQQICSNHVFFL